MTVPTQPEPSDATRFATRPKQRRKELVNATDNEMGKLRKETIAEAIGAVLAGNVWKARVALAAGMWRQHDADDRTLDPETVAEQFTRAEREYAAAIHNRAVIREYGITA
jgi:hypothetical protein